MLILSGLVCMCCCTAAEDGLFKLDLKGVLYQATVLPLAGTALVVNMGPTEAKVKHTQQ